MDPIAPAAVGEIEQPEHPLQFLVGTWVGSGEGIYPTIPSFRYNERVTMTLSPKGFVAYQQSTSHPDSGAPMHAETGYLRSVGANAVEWVLAQPSGIVEIHQGNIANAPGSGFVVEFEPVLVATSPSAKSVTAIQRSIVVHQNVLTYKVAMAAVGLALQHHLSATLKRVE
jgi:THAP4-like, heme-binding beta-barrel domain